MGIYARNLGEWYNVYEGGLAGSGGAPGAAVISDAIADDPLFPVNTFSFTGDGTNGDDGQAYDVYEFLGSGQLVIDEPGLVDALVIAGGGGSWSGNTYSYCGGAGGMLEVSDFFIDSTKTVTVGGGGPTGTAPNSEIVGTCLLAVGGGGGTAGTHASLAYQVSPGGSGGGGSWSWSVPGQGHDGGAGNRSAGGGAGGPATTTTPGIGKESNITGSDVMYCVGGGNGTENIPNTGNGKGTQDPGTIGNSGIAIVRVKVASGSFGPKTRSAVRTAHAARVENGVVRQVIVIPHLDDDDQKITAYCNRIGLPGTWVDTSYTGSRRGQYAGVGDTFTMTRSGGEFVSPEIETVEIEEPNV